MQDNKVRTNAGSPFFPSPTGSRDRAACVVSADQLRQCVWDRAAVHASPLSTLQSFAAMSKSLRRRTRTLGEIPAVL